MSKYTRREFLQLSTVAAAGVLAAACAKTPEAAEPPAAPQEDAKAEATATPKPAEPAASPYPASGPWSL